MTSSATASGEGAPLLAVRDLVVEFQGDGGAVRAVDGLGFELDAGRTLGLVGESGCGKSVTALSLLGLLPRPAARIAGGRVLWRGEDLAAAPPERLRRVRTGEIGIVFQEPMSALNPVQRIGRQLAEAIQLHRGASARSALEQAVDWLRRVGIPEPELRCGDLPHRLSGGMRQRVMIAMALSCRPALLIADEPTTALDVTVQAQVLDLLRGLQDEFGMALLLITHDLGVVAEACDEVLVMYAGRAAERGPVEAVFARPAHPYTRGLLACVPRLDAPRKSRLPAIEGSVPALDALPGGCRFADRCPHRAAACATAPEPAWVGELHAVSCHRWRELAPAAREAP